jgi:hypothetical protein
MKQVYITFIALIFSITLFAQGIAVQGIARDNNKAALPQEDLNFTFRIISKDGDERYTESQSIRTDNFGVFSHIVGTGTKLNSVDFSEQGLKIEVSILYPNKVIVYNEGFNYTPYAHYAANGVPTGSIMPFMGTTAPKGWLLCNGATIPTVNAGNYDPYVALRAMFSNNRTPNLQGRFLKGAGSNSNPDALSSSIHDTTTLGEYQTQALLAHNHEKGTISTDGGGAHGHSDVLINFDRGGTLTGDNRGIVFNSAKILDAGNGDDAFRYDNLNAGGRYFNSRGRIADNNDKEYKFIGSAGSEHDHPIIGSTASAGGKENRPNSFSVNYIIKL